MRPEQITGARPLTAFSIYLRTGRRVAPSDVEVKFNPWHDPANGQFTFAGRGEYSPGNGQSAEGGPGRPADGNSGQDAIDSDTSGWKYNPKNPQNYSIYVVRRGDTLTHIASYRKGLSTKDIAWLNDMPLDRLLRIGQRIKVPHQQFLEERRRAFSNLKALAFYLDTHEGRLPPNVAKAPSVFEQLNSDFRQVSANGYRYDVDIIDRMRRLTGTVIENNAQVRSRSAQANAGKPDRLPTDEGGHYIARRFNGPTIDYNHFAQDANFNRSAYAKLENEWSAAKRGGHQVQVDIVPSYEGVSRRPYAITVNYSIDGYSRRRVFPNIGKRKK